jgi:hypothetical protein
MFFSRSPSLASPRTPQSPSLEIEEEPSGKYELPYEFTEDVDERFVTEDGEQLDLKFVVGGNGPVKLEHHQDMDVEDMQSQENAKEKEKEMKRKGKKFTSPHAQKSHVDDIKAGKTMSRRWSTLPVSRSTAVHGSAGMPSASPPAEKLVGVAVPKTRFGALPARSGSLVNDEQADWNAMMVQLRKTRAKIASEAISERLKAALQVPKKAAVAPPVVSRVVAEVMFWVEEVDEKKGQMEMEMEMEKE